MRQDGYTLVEVIVSMLIMSVLVTSVFSVALSTRGGTGKGERRLYAAAAQKGLASSLRNFVTGDSVGAQFFGPNTNNATNRWSIHKPGIQHDSQGNAWALNPGVHTLNCVASPPNDGMCFVPRALREPPYYGTISYAVSAGSPPQVNITVNWNEP